jgi:translation initiation factor 2B subunit (eIF-2B alpha/beta/delta family)/8-oxo-dGTP pyrophosphatase MutT (NUDIX family)
MDEKPVVTVFLRNRGEILLLHRSDDVGSYPGQWAAVAGHVENSSAESAHREIREETGITGDALDRVRTGEPFTVEDADLGTAWEVNPFLFACDTRSVELNWESTTAEWTSPTAILDRETVPRLWTSYDSVRPTVETIRTDTAHGSTYLSIRALEVLRDEAGIVTREEAENSTQAERIVDCAQTLLEARPAMSVLANRINRVMSAADGDPAVVEDRAHQAIDRAVNADTEAARHASDHLGGRVATLSRSETVLEALERASPEAVLLPESRPGREGVTVSELLADETEVTLTTDAAFAQQLHSWEADTLVSGADAILADGRVVNKVGTRAAAIAASHEGITALVVAARDKVSPTAEVDLEERPPTELYDGNTPLTIANPTFDVTPAACVDTVITENGDADTASVRNIAGEHRTRTGWSDAWDSAD